MATEEAVVDESTVETFKESLGGELLQPGADGYDAARQVYNAMIDRRPALIACCAGVADVMQAVSFGREHGLAVAVRGGGHSVAGNCLCEGGLMIDLSPMKGIRVDPAARTVRAQGGVLWRELDRESQAFGLATTGGIVSTTGIAGLTLGGGFGWLARQHGLACDNLLSADLVTADGRCLTASATENPDLFWGLRGGGGNFGVVTSFEYRLHPVGQMLGGMLIHPFDRAREVLRYYRDFTSAIPDELTVYAVLLTSPEGEKVVALLVAYNGPLADGEALVKPLREFGPPLADLVQPVSYGQVQTQLDEGFPPGLQNYWKSSFLKGLSDEAIDTMVEHFTAVPSPLSAVAIELFGGAMGRVDKAATAFSPREAKYNLLLVSRWGKPAEAEPNVRWTRDLFQAMRPFSLDAVYANYLEGGQEGADRIHEVFGPNYERLAALKQSYDPTNFFSLNQNVKPAG